MELFKERLIMAMQLRNIRAADLSRMTGISKARISQYTNGIYEAKQKALCLLAEALEVNELWLMGNDVPMERRTERKYEDENILNINGIYKLEKKKFPMLGEIACGSPILTYEDHESYVVSGSDLQADFCLLAKGDSMTGSRIHDGDIVFIQKAEMVNNGEIAAVVINDEATLKRVYYYPDDQKLVLIPSNPTYEPLVFIGDQLEDIRILGKAVAFQSTIRL